MVRLRSVNLKLKFNTSYNTHPVAIKYRGLTVLDEIDIFLENIDQTECLEFSGFNHKDKTQRVICSIFCNEQLLDTTALCSFQMKNNKYVNNVKLTKYDRIFFNGELELRFFKEWIECNLLSGMLANNKKTDYINWVKKYEHHRIDRNRTESLKNYDIICVGASMTHGTEQLDKSKTWPGQLQNMLHLHVGNFGTEGADHFSILHNIEYVIRHFNVKKIIVLLPPSFGLPKRIEFLGKYVFFQCSYNIKKKYLFFNSKIESWRKKIIIKEVFIKNFLSKKLKKIEKMCIDKNIDLSLIYQTMDVRNNFNYSSIRFKNFVFPQYTAKQSLENGHPDETVHLKFAEQIIKNL